MKKQLQIKRNEVAKQMAKIIRSKLFIGILCIVLAGAVAFLLLPRYYRSQSATEDVIRVAQDNGLGDDRGHF